MSLFIGERPGRTLQSATVHASRPTVVAPEVRAKRDGFTPSKTGKYGPEWDGQPVNPPSLKPYVDRARKIGFGTFLGIGGASLTGILGGIVTCAFNPPLGMAIIAGSTLINAGAVGTMILLAREDSVAEADRRSASLAERFAPSGSDATD